jgi:hypothetical protein
MDDCHIREIFLKTLYYGGHFSLKTKTLDQKDLMNTFIMSSNDIFPSTQCVLYTSQSLHPM